MKRLASAPEDSQVLQIKKSIEGQVTAPVLPNVRDHILELNEKILWPAKQFCRQVGKESVIVACVES